MYPKCFLTVLLITYVVAYKPVVLIHGIMTGNKSMLPFAEKIKEAHPGTLVYVPDEFTGFSSLHALWEQIEKFGAYIEDISENHPDGIHIIGYSQGGLIARGVIELFPNINVKKFISLSSPQGGQYGTKFLHIYFPGLTLKHAHRLFYSYLGQKTSVGNYWKDPNHMERYLKYSNFLPYVNNEILTENSEYFKAQIMKLEKLILIGGPDDGIITPWKSSQFGYFDKNGDVVDLKDQETYKFDSLGLKTLNDTGRLKIIELPGIYHHAWHSNPTVIKECIIPELD